MDIYTDINSRRRNYCANWKIFPQNWLTLIAQHLMHVRRFLTLSFGVLFSAQVIKRIRIVNWGGQWPQQWVSKTKKKSQQQNFAKNINLIVVDVYVLFKCPAIHRPIHITLSYFCGTALLTRDERNLHQKKYNSYWIICFSSIYQCSHSHSSPLLVIPSLPQLAHRSHFTQNVTSWS